MKRGSSAAQGVTHIGQRILRRRRVIGVRERLHPLQENPGAFEIARTEGAVTLLVGIFRDLALVQFVLRDAAEPVGGLVIKAAVEQVLRPAKVHLRHQKGFGPAVQESLGPFLVTRALHLDGTERRVAFGVAPGNVLEQAGRLRIHAVPEEVQGAGVFRSLRGSGERKKGGRRGQKESFLHVRRYYFTKIRIFLIIFV